MVGTDASLPLIEKHSLPLPGDHTESSPKANAFQDNRLPSHPARHHDTYAKNDGVLSAWFGRELPSVTWEVTGHSPSELQELIYARRN